MKHCKRTLSMVLLIVFILPSFFCGTLYTQKYKWTEIKEFKFYGKNNPLKTKGADFISADLSLITELLVNSVKCDGYFPKGVQYFATIEFNDAKSITIQILPGIPAPFRVIKGKLFDDDWFEFNEKTAIKWLNYVDLLSQQLSKK